MLVLKKQLKAFDEDQHTRYQQVTARLQKYTNAGLLGFLSSNPWNLKYRTVDSAYIVALYDCMKDRVQEGGNQSMPAAVIEYLDHLKKQIERDGDRDKIFDTDSSITPERLWGVDHEDL
jgi:hypothetical protein